MGMRGRGGPVPALRRTIWSFWQRSMKPCRRLANSTTYWMASVMRPAQRCHISSIDCGTGRHPHHRAPTKPPRTSPSLCTTPELRASSGCPGDCNIPSPVPPPRWPHLLLVGADLLAGEGVPAPELQVLGTELARLPVRLEDVLGEVLCGRRGLGDVDRAGSPCPSPQRARSRHRPAPVGDRPSPHGHVAPRNSPISTPEDVGDSRRLPTSGWG